jgi:hypothetical protein
VRRAATALPALPNEGVIAWAQAALSLPNLAFMEIDTTGLDQDDEIVRFTLLDAADDGITDILIKPSSRRLSAGAAAANGLSSAQLDADGWDIKDAWPRIRSALLGRYVVSYAQAWDLEQLSKIAKRHELAQIALVGDDLKRYTAIYYGESRGLRLEDLAFRAGYLVKSKSSIDRCRAQHAIVQAMANAVIDARPASPPVTVDDDDLGDLDEQPF